MSKKHKDHPRKDHSARHGKHPDKDSGKEKAAAGLPAKPAAPAADPPAPALAAPAARPCGDQPKPRKEKMKEAVYEGELAKLQVELVKLQEWIKCQGLKVVVLFEGRDAAGKGGAIKRITETLNPRVCRVVALGTPTEREKTQWYFQRYVAHLPAAGEMVLFDRSWYNRAGVERVMGFCTEEEYQEFLRSCPEFERMLVRSGIILVKYWFSVSDDEQERRFQAADRGPHQALEAQPDGPGVAGEVGGVLQGQGRDVRLHRHQAGALVRGRRRRQEAGPAQLHRPPAEPDPLRGPDAGAHRAAAAPGPLGLRPPPADGPELRPGDLLIGSCSCSCSYSCSCS